MDDPIDAEVVQFGLLEGSVTSKETHPDRLLNGRDGLKEGWKRKKCEIPDQTWTIDNERDSLISAGTYGCIRARWDGGLMEGKRKGKGKEDGDVQGMDDALAPVDGWPSTIVFTE